MQSRIVKSNRNDWDPYIVPVECGNLLHVESTETVWQTMKNIRSMKKEV